MPRKSAENIAGSYFRSGGKVRITGQLIDASTGTHLWAERFDGGLEDIFDLQDQVTASGVGAIAPKLEQAEIERAKRKPTERLDAYDYSLRGLAALYQWTKAGNTEALSLFNRAIELDAHFASAYAMAARCYVERKSSDWVADPAREVAEAERLARRAAEFGKDDAVALCVAGLVLAIMVGDFNDGTALIDQSLLLNPNLAVAWSHSGWLKIYLGEPDAAAEHRTRAMRLSPHDPSIGYMQTGAACAKFLAGRYVEALQWAEAGAREKPNFGPALRALAACSVMAGRPEQAQKAMARMRELYPTFRIADVKGMFPVRRAEDLAKWEEALRRAGLPE